MFITDRCQPSEEAARGLTSSSSREYLKKLSFSLVWISIAFCTRAVAVRHGVERPVIAA